VITRRPLRTGCGKWNLIVFPRATGAAIFSCGRSDSACSVLWEAFGGLGGKSIGKQLQRRDFFLLIFVSGELFVLRAQLSLRRVVPIAAITAPVSSALSPTMLTELIQKSGDLRDSIHARGNIRR